MPTKANKGNMYCSKGFVLFFNIDVVVFSKQLRLKRKYTNERGRVQMELYLECTLCAKQCTDSALSLRPSDFSDMNLLYQPVGSNKSIGQRNIHQMLI